MGKSVTHSQLMWPPITMLTLLWLPTPSNPIIYNNEIGSLHEYGIPIVINQAIYQAIQQKIEVSRRHKREIKDLIRATKGYLEQINIKPEYQEKLLEILISKLVTSPT